MKKTIINKITKMKNSDLTRIGLKNITSYKFINKIIKTKKPDLTRIGLKNIISYKPDNPPHKQKFMNPRNKQRFDNFSYKPGD